VQHHAERRVNRKSDAIHQAVRDLQGMNGEGSNLETFSRTNFAQIGRVEKLVFIELIFDVGKRELGGPDRDVQFAENPGQGSDVIFVPVRKHDAAHQFAIFDQIRNIGNNNIDAEQFGFGKHEPGIYDHDVIAIADGHAVHAELAHAAERNNMQFSF
jgi:hypothetical protein